MLQTRRAHTGSTLLPADPADAAALSTARPERRSFERRGVSSLQLDALESERQRIARELHDELGQRLSAAKLVLAEVTRAAGHRANLAGGLEDLGKVLDETVDAVRQLARDLRPPMLDDLGLNSAIESLAATTGQRLGIQIDLQLDADPAVLGSAATIAVYRIVQEALTNVARHSQASRVRIETRLADGLWQLQIDDNGVGIGQRDPNTRGSLGLVGMRERALLLGGVFSITALPDGGTRVNVKLPLEPRDTNSADDRSQRLSGVTNPALEHELTVHQIELESQNEELRRAQVDLCEARDRYLDLYDFAPVGYLTIDHRGLIVEANVSAASLLGDGRDALIGSQFSRYVGKQDAQRWLRHAARTMLGHGPQAVDLRLQPASGMAFHARMDCLRFVRSGAEPVLRATLSDVSARTHAAMSRRIALRAVDDSEAERRRVSRTLHEDLAQELSVLKMDLSRLHAQPGQPAHDSSIGTMLASLDHAVSTVRRIAVDLRPPMLDDLGLNAAINWLASDVATRTGVAITVHHDDEDPPLDEAQCVGVFRLLQAALSLVTRNAAGQAATIQLHHFDDQLELLLESSGTGWPLDDAIEPAITAQSPLIQQAHLLGGRIEVEESSHQSRRVAFCLPLPSRGSP
jgi:PAS domain S-box-containing protein